MQSRDTYASAKENLGSRVEDEATGAVEYKDVDADAEVDEERGVVISHADFPFIGGGSDSLAASIFGTESFHNGDYDALPQGGVPGHGTFKGHGRGDPSGRDGDDGEIMMEHNR